MKVAGIIDSLATQGGIDILRSGPKVKNILTGVWEEQAPVSIHLEPVVVHNLSGRDLDQLPEADRNRETIEIYTKVRLYVSDGGFYTDRVVYRGRRFRVIQAMDYAIQGGCYITIASLEDKQVA